MDKIKKIPACGDIFMIPLYLPSYQKWRDPLFDEFIDYKRYRFHPDDPFAFGRIIEPYAKNLYIMKFSVIRAAFRTARNVSFNQGGF